MCLFWGVSYILLWTIQNFLVYEQLQSTGHFFASKKRPAIEPCFQHAYDWISEKMIRRGIFPISNNSRPIWAWYQWEGKRKRRDMRFKGYAERGQKIVQLAIEIEDKEVLLSDFDKYHYVLNKWYLPADEADSQNFEEECRTLGVNLYINCDNDQIKENTRIKDRIARSWDRIFDLASEEENIIFGLNYEKSIQATFWEIRREQVVSSEVFIAK